MKFQETTTALGVSATYTGQARSDRSGRDFFVASAIASHASAANGFRILASFDDVTYRAIAQMTLPAEAPRVISCPAIFPFYKVELVNGTTAQTYLTLASGFTNNVSEFGSVEALTTTVVGPTQIGVAAGIASASSLSAAIDLGERRAVRIITPASWTAAALTFQVSYDGTTWDDLYDENGTEVSYTLVAGKSMRLPISDWLGVRHLKLRSGTSTVPVNQAAARSFVLVAQ